MFGPFNTVRAILVAGAVIAALVAAALGWWIVTAILALSILAHGLLWVWLYQQAETGAPREEGSRNLHDETPEV